MADEGTGFSLTEEALRISLTDEKLKSFTSHILTGVPWRSHHAEFQRIVLTLKDGIKISAVVKRFIHPEHSSDPVYSVMHDPSFLYTREKTNLRLVGDLMTETGEHSLVPNMYGWDDNSKLLITEDLGKANMTRQLLGKSGSERDKLFTRGIKTVSRFVGTCQRYHPKLDAAGGYDKNTESQRKYTLAMKAENLLRLYYNITPKCQKEVGEYDTGKVRKYLQSEGSNLEARLTELADLRIKALPEKDRLQHNDCNGLNMIGGKLVDLEDFGYSSPTTDISSYCIIVGIGNSAIFRQDNLTRYNHLYLAYLYAYENENIPNALSKRSIGNLQNGHLGHFVVENVFKYHEPLYADWTFSFFASAITKNIQLAATSGRYNDVVQKKNNDPGLIITSDKILSYIRELFSTVGGMSGISGEDSQIERCSSPKQVRDYFCAYGRLLLDLGLYSASKEERGLFESALKKIEQGIISGGVKQNWPVFTKPF